MKVINEYHVQTLDFALTMPVGAKIMRVDVVGPYTDAPEEKALMWVLEDPATAARCSRQFRVKMCAGQLDDDEVHSFGYLDTFQVDGTTYHLFEEHPAKPV